VKSGLASFGSLDFFGAGELAGHVALWHAQTDVGGVGERLAA
jgi:hypothetical protein